MNTRTLVSLPDDDKRWLDDEAAARGRPMTHLVQDAVAEYRVRAGSRRGESFEQLLSATSGLFTRRRSPPQDGATLQRQLREEWDRSPPLRARRASA